LSKILVIPDTQVKDGVPLEHLEWAGNYAAIKKPDVIVHIGDYADMESLGLYDVGKKQFEGRRYRKDIDAAIQGMDMFMGPINAEQERLRKNKEKLWKPRRIITLGNHEDRINRAVESDPKLEGVLSLKDLKYEEYGWEVVPYLEPIVVDGVAFCHFFTSGILGKPVTSAQALLNKKHMSCVMGHVQGRQIAYGTRADGKQMTGLFVGGFYQHDENYLKWQGNKHWRGIWMLHEVNDGSFDEMPISLAFLKRKYS
jgi:hypothetical protein